MEASGEEGRSATEGRLMCGMLRGLRCPFIGAERGAQVVVKAVGDQSDCGGGEWRLRPLKLAKARVEGA
jgi:hypothetical protein